MRVEIRKCTASEIISHPCFPALRREYVEEAANVGLPDPQEKLAVYLAIEASGAFCAFAAFLGDELVGFVTVIAPVIAHYGMAIAVTESLFVASAHRKTGAGMLLIRAAEKHSKEVGSPSMLMTAPSRGRLAQLLPRIGYSETNKCFIKRFNDE